MGWISVKDIMPKLTENGCSENLLFAVVYKDGHQVVHGGYYTGRWRIWAPGGMDTRTSNYRVTHWMPEPSPPTASYDHE